jgi:glutamyl-tRNA reductase
MQIGVLGVTHERAPVEIREQIAFTDKQKLALMEALVGETTDEMVILATCNRSEIYFASSHIQQTLTQAKAYIEQFLNIQIDEYFFCLEDELAIEHLFRVTTGLDSAIVGEDQILGQVKSALEFSKEAGGVSKFLNKAFREAITFAKKMHTLYKVSEHPLSLAYIGVSVLKREVKDLQYKKALVVGTGEMGKLVLRYLENENLQKVYAAIREQSKCKAMPLMKEFKQVEWVPYEERYTLAEEVDIIFSVTSSPHKIFKQSKYPSVSKKQWLFDLALPRDMEEGLGQRPFATLYNIDHLKEIADENLERRKDLACQIEGHIGEEVILLSKWVTNAKLDPFIKSFHRLSDEVAKDTIDMMHKKVALNTRETVFMEQLIHTALKRVITPPIHALKSLEDQEEIKAYQKMLEKLLAK